MQQQAVAAAIQEGFLEGHIDPWAGEGAGWSDPGLAHAVTHQVT